MDGINMSTSFQDLDREPRIRQAINAKADTNGTDVSGSIQGYLASVVT